MERQRSWVVFSLVFPGGIAVLLSWHWIGAQGHLATPKGIWATHFDQGYVHPLCFMEYKGMFTIVVVALNWRPRSPCYSHRNISDPFLSRVRSPSSFHEVQGYVHHCSCGTELAPKVISLLPKEYEWPILIRGTFTHFVSWSTRVCLQLSFWHWIAAQGHLVTPTGIWATHFDRGYVHLLLIPPQALRLKGMFTILSIPSVEGLMRPFLRLSCGVSLDLVSLFRLR